MDRETLCRAGCRTLGALTSRSGCSRARTFVFNPHPDPPAPEGAPLSCPGADGKGASGEVSASREWPPGAWSAHATPLPPPAPVRASRTRPAPRRLHVTQRSHFHLIVQALSTGVYVSALHSLQWRQVGWTAGAAGIRPMWSYTRELLTRGSGTNHRSCGRRNFCSDAFVQTRTCV